MLKLLRTSRQPATTPITDTLQEAAAILGIDADTKTATGGFLSQAIIIREIAKRIVELEARAK